MPRQKSNRRQQILETLARELETHPGSRITTAELAAAVGVSEAALYRHFASKARMFEALIDFAEDSVFGIINTILAQDRNPVTRCEKIIRLLLGFAERNPGITRVLLGDALVGEHERLRVRVNQFFERIETQLKQVLREANLSNEVRLIAPIDVTANYLLAIAEGKISHYARGGFTRSPTEHWEEQWSILRDALFRQ
jgi:TetR/AcrR family transcriptional regulator